MSCFQLHFIHRIAIIRRKTTGVVAPVEKGTKFNDFPIKFETFHKLNFFSEVNLCNEIFCDTLSLREGQIINSLKFYSKCISF